MANFKEIIQIQGDTAHVDQKIRQVNTQLDQIGTEGTKKVSMVTKGFTLLKAGIAGALLAGTLAFKSMTKSATELQTEMANVRTLAKWNNEEFRIMTETVQGLSQNLPNSAVDLAQGLYQVVSASVPANKQLKVLESTAKAGTAGLSSTTEALNLSGAVIKAYGKDWSETDKILDNAFKTVELGQTTFPELSIGIQEVASSASTLNIKNEELFGTFATLTGVTGNTAKVATQLKGVLMGLIKPKEELTKLIQKETGMSIQQAVSEKGLIGILEIVKNKTKGNTEAVGQLFESREALNALLALTGEQYDVLIDKTNQVIDSQGSMEEAFRIQMDTFNNQLKLISNKMKPAWTGFVGILTDGLKVINKLTEASLEDTYKDERIELFKLFAVAKDYTGDAENRAEAIRKINEKYGDYLPNLLTEKSNIDELEGAHNRVSMALIRRMAIEINEEKIKAKLAEADKLTEQQPELIVRKAKAEQALTEEKIKQEEAENKLTKTLESQTSATERSTVAGSDALLMADKYAETAKAGGTSVHKATVEVENSTKAYEDNKSAIGEVKAEVAELIRTGGDLTKDFEDLFGVGIGGKDKGKDTGGGGGGSSDLTEKEKALLSAWENERYKMKADSFKKELEQINNHEFDVKTMLQKLYEKELLTKEEHEQALTDIEAHFSQKRKEITQAELQAKMNIYSNMANALGSVVGVNRKNAKAVAKIQAIQSGIDAFSSAQTAFAQTKLPPPFPAIAYASTLAIGLAQSAKVWKESKKLKAGGILTAPVFSPLIQNGAIAGEAGREAVIPLDQNGGIFGQMRKELKEMNKQIKRLDMSVNIKSEIDGVRFVRETIEPSERVLKGRRW